MLIITTFTCKRSALLLPHSHIKQESEKIGETFKGLGKGSTCYVTIIRYRSKWKTLYGCTPSHTSPTLTHPTNTHPPPNTHIPHQHSPTTPPTLNHSQTHTHSHSSIYLCKYYTKQSYLSPPCFLPSAAGCSEEELEAGGAAATAGNFFPDLLIRSSSKLTSLSESCT